MKKLIIYLLGLGVVGCSSLSNPCQDQGEGHCASVTTAYQNSLDNTSTAADMPRNTQTYNSGTNQRSDSNSSDLVAMYDTQNSYSQQPVLGTAVRTQTKEMRVWILPYEDDVGLYHDQQYVYAVVKKGNWKYKSMSLANTKKQFANTSQVGDNSLDYKPFTENSPKQNENASLALPFQPVNQTSTPATSNSATNSGLIGMPNPFSTNAIQAKNNAALNSTPTEASSTASSTTGN